MSVVCVQKSILMHLASLVIDVLASFTLSTGVQNVIKYLAVLQILPHIEDGIGREMDRTPPQRKGMTQRTKGAEMAILSC